MYTPCKECHEKGESYLGCHGKCQKYIEWKAERDAIRAEVIKKAEAIKGVRDLNKCRMKSFGKLSSGKRGSRISI